MNGIVQCHRKQICTLGIFLNNSTIIGFADCDKKYMAMMPKSIDFLNQSHLITVIYTLVTTLEKYPEIATGAKWMAADQQTVQHDKLEMITHKDLHWLLDACWAQFTVMMLSFKKYLRGSNYLWDCLSC